jgi:hypothetical protein
LVDFSHDGLTKGGNESARAIFNVMLSTVTKSKSEQNLLFQVGACNWLLEGFLVLRKTIAPSSGLGWILASTS